MDSKPIDGNENAASYAGKLTGKPYAVWQLMGCQRESVESGIYAHLKVPPALEVGPSAEGLMDALDGLPNFSMEEFLDAHRAVFVDMVKEHLEEVTIDVGEEGGLADNISAMDKLLAMAASLPAEQSPMRREHVVLDLGEGESAYLVAEDIPEAARDALSGLIHIELAEMALTERDGCQDEGDELGAMKYQMRFSLALFVLGSICQRLQVRPFTPLFEDGKLLQQKRSEGGKASSDISEAEWPKVEQFIDRQMRIGRKKCKKTEACRRARRALLQGELLDEPVEMSVSGLRKRYNKSKRADETKPPSALEAYHASDSFSPKLTGKQEPNTAGPVAQEPVKRVRRDTKQSLESDFPDSDTD